MDAATDASMDAATDAGDAAAPVVTVVSAFNVVDGGAAAQGNVNGDGDFSVDGWEGWNDACGTFWGQATAANITFSPTVGYPGGSGAGSVAYTFPVTTSAYSPNLYFHTSWSMWPSGLSTTFAGYTLSARVCLAATTPTATISASVGYENPSYTTTKGTAETLTLTADACASASDWTLVSLTITDTVGQIAVYLNAPANSTCPSADAGVDAGGLGSATVYIDDVTVTVP